MIFLLFFIFIWACPSRATAYTIQKQTNIMKILNDIKCRSRFQLAVARSGRAASGFAIASVILVALLFIVIIVSKCLVLPSLYLSFSQWPQGSTGFAALRIPHANFSQKSKVESKLSLKNLKYPIFIKNIILYHFQLSTFY
jgi:hypothetical protein